MMMRSYAALLAFALPASATATATATVTAPHPAPAPRSSPLPLSKGDAGSGRAWPIGGGQETAQAKRVRDACLRACADAIIARLGIPAGEARFQLHSDRCVRRGGGEAELEERTFTYRRFVDGVPAYGPGTFARVGVKPDGTPGALMVSWPERLRVPARVQDAGPVDARAVLERHLEGRAPAGCVLEGVGLRYLTAMGEDGELTAEPAAMGLVRLPGSENGTEGEPLLVRLHWN